MNNYGTFSTDGVAINLTGYTITNEVGGLVIGNGTINGNVVNNGIFSPGGNGTAGKITVNGNFTQNSGGTVHIDIGGTTAATQYDELAVSATATLAGTDAVNYLGNFTPTLGTYFGVVVAGNVTGNVTVTGGTIGNVTLVPAYDSTDQYLEAVRGTAQIPTHLVFGTQPGNTTAGVAIPTFTVKVEDASGDVVTSNTSTVTVSLGQRPTGAILGGTLTAKASGGIASFTRYTATWRAVTRWRLPMVI